MFIFIPTSSAFAETQGQKSIGDIGVEIKWFDFGAKYKTYRIQDVYGTDYYQISILADDEGKGFKEGFINGKGEIVITPDAFDISHSFSRGLSTTTAEKGNDYYLINAKGVSKIDPTPYTKIGGFDNGYAAVTLKSNAQNGVIDETGKLLFTHNYEDLHYMGEGIFAGSNGYEQSFDEGAGYLLNSSGKLLSQTYYDMIYYASEETIKVFQNQKYGFLDLSGNEIVSPIYDDAISFYEGAAVVKKGGKWGLIDKAGKELAAPIYDEISQIVNNLYKVTINDKQGVMNSTGELVLPVEYDDILDLDLNRFMELKENETFLMNSNGNSIVFQYGQGYSQLSLTSDGKIYAEKKLDNLNISTFLDKEGTVLTGFKEFSMYSLNENLYLGSKHGEYPPGVTPPHDYAQKFALLDSEGNNLTGFNYSNHGDFLNNLLIVNKEYYGTEGLLNQYGAEVLPTVFDSIILTDEGYAIVQISDPDDGANSRVGYFKIPTSFNEKKRTPPVTVYLDNVELYFDTEPTIKNGSTMVPMRKIFETLGTTIEWDNETKTVTSKSNDDIISLTIGQTTAYKNGEEIQLDAAPFIQNDKTLVPIRFISESIGADVKWDQDNRRVLIDRSLSQPSSAIKN